MSNQRNNASDVWEYYIAKDEHPSGWPDSDAYSDWLNGLGQEGWEFVAFHGLAIKNSPDKNTLAFNLPIHIFKRRKPAEPARKIKPDIY